MPRLAATELALWQNPPRTRTPSSWSSLAALTHCALLLGKRKALRALVQEINERFNDFQVKYSDRDKQDCLVMTLLTYADELRSARKNG